jgi:transposase
MHGNCSLFVKKPKPSEWDRLKEVARKKDRNIRDRAMVVILSAEGFPVPEIMIHLARCREYVIYWIKRFNNYGFEGLETPHRPGRPPKFTDATIEKIKTIAISKPGDLGLAFTTWSLSKLQRYLIRKGIVSHISWDSIRRLLKRTGFSLREAQKWMVSDDPHFAFKKNE